MRLVYSGGGGSPKTSKRTPRAGLPGKGPRAWASSHLTSASALYRPHTMGLGTTPAPPATPRLCSVSLFRTQVLPWTQPPI